MAHSDVSSAGTKISMGDRLPYAPLSMATVVGSRCTAAVFMTMKRTISFEAVPSAAPVSVFKRLIASSPNGVAALPSPKRLAVMFIDMAETAGESFLSFGNKKRMSGEIARAMSLVSPACSAMFIIPLQKQMTPISFRHSVMADAPPETITSDSAPMLPLAAAQKHESAMSSSQI